MATAADIRKRIGIVLILAFIGGVAALVIPPILEAKTTALFDESLRKIQLVEYPEPEEGPLDGVLPWGTTVRSLDRASLPVIPGAVAVIVPKRDRSHMSLGENRLVPERLHEVTFDLPADLRAPDPEHIKTMVFLIPYSSLSEYDRVDLDSGARTPSSATSVDYLVRLRIYDLEQKLLVGSWVLHGESAPDMAKTKDELKTRPPPIAEFIAALPRR